MTNPRFTFLILFLSFISFNSFCQSSGGIVLGEGLVVKLDRSGYSDIISPNEVIAKVVTGQWKAPSENEQVKSDGKIVGTWEKAEADSAGWFRGDSFRNAYLYFQYESDEDDIVLLEANGNTMVVVNGVGRSGNLYSYKDEYDDWEVRFDYSLIPVKVNKGKNDFLFSCGRGYFKARIHPGKEGLTFNNKDLTTPDVIVSEAPDYYGAIPVINATEETYKDLMVKTWSENSTPEYYKLNVLNPLSIFKTPFHIKLPAQSETGKIKLNIDLVNKENGSENILASTAIQLNVLNSNDTRKETFMSNLDGSVQYYAVNLPENLQVKPALFLSLHGAGVEAINQAHAYGSKNWGYLVAPTNRRPYGYNWENWGRMDALEVLNIAKKKFNIDENRVYLTGHSMGGHGTWHLGINYPDKFAAFGPSAGWISIWSYRIRPELDSTEVEQMLIRSAKQSDTYALSPNLRSNGIYIIHGSEDDNVPPEQSESMMDTLSKHNINFIYHEEKGAGHWWDNSDEPGADCVDWPPMFDFFAHHSKPGNDLIKIIDFMTANPAASSKNYWVEIINQVEQQKLSRINIRLEPASRRFIGTTSNIEMLSIDASMLPADDTISINLDDQIISDIMIPSDNKVYLVKKNNKWELTGKPGEEHKTPERCGNFREVLNHNVVFVYGSQGSEEENRWAFEKARHDAEVIWYQGNGAVEVIEDNDFSLDEYKDRSVILFGNSETNSAWDLLLKDSPVQVNNSEIKVGDEVHKGEDLSCLMIRPRSDSKLASVGVVSGTGIEGMKLVNLARYSHQYLSFPDIVIYNSDILMSDKEGVKLTGYFGNDWSLEKGEFVKQ